MQMSLSKLIKFDQSQKKKEAEEEEKELGTHFLCLGVIRDIDQDAGQGGCPGDTGHHSEQ